MALWVAIMIITKIIGGLGNQMFQYAVGRAVSLKLGQTLLLDVSDFSTYELHHGFELQRVFNCQAATAGKADVQGVLGWQYSPAIRRLVVKKRLRLVRRPSLVIEPHYHYWPGIEDVPLNCYLDGYWQSEKYFAKSESVLRSDFTFTNGLTGKNIDIVEQIDRHNAVSIHVRRGDYATNMVTNATHGLCSLDYYQRAIEYIRERVECPHFYIFSDDIRWVRNNLAVAEPCVYIDHNQGTESYNDMRLMSLCRHNIIANSTFSWWGAWLNSRANKIVIAPHKWFANNYDISDLYPRGWVAL